MGGWGWLESRIRLISAETEAGALLGLAELGKKYIQDRKEHSYYNDTTMPVQLDHQSILQEIYSVLFLFRS